MSFGIRLGKHITMSYGMRAEGYEVYADGIKRNLEDINLRWYISMIAADRMMEPDTRLDFYAEDRRVTGGLMSVLVLMGMEI